jgi:hypothetical protein
MTASHQLVRDELCRLIADSCAVLDTRFGNEPGTAERAIYWAYWPPSETTSVAVLRSLAADALAAVKLHADDGAA